MRRHSSDALGNFYTSRSKNHRSKRPASWFAFFKLAIHTCNARRVKLAVAKRTGRSIPRHGFSLPTPEYKLHSENKHVLLFTETTDTRSSLKPLFAVADPSQACPLDLPLIMIRVITGYTVITRVTLEPSRRFRRAISDASLCGRCNRERATVGNS